MLSKIEDFYIPVIKFWISLFLTNMLPQVHQFGPAKLLLGSKRIPTSFFPETAIRYQAGSICGIVVHVILGAIDLVQQIKFILI